MLWPGGIFAALALICADAGTGGQQPPALAFSGERLFLPFSSLYGPQEDEQRRLENAIEALEAVAAAKVVVVREGPHPRVTITIRWRQPAGQRAEVVKAIRRIALHLVPGARPDDILIADASGRLWMDSGQRKDRGQWPWLIVTMVAVGAVLAGTVGRLWWRAVRAPGADRTRSVPSGPLRGETPVSIARMLSGASPAVRGVVLASLDERYRQRVLRFLSGPVEMPQAAPAQEVVEAIVAALRDASQQGDDT